MQRLTDLRIYMLSMGLNEILDVLLVAALVYGLLYVVRGTRAIQLLRGILLLVLFSYLFSQFLELPAFTGIMRQILPAILVSIPVIFQPELRRAFERLGRAGIFTLRSADEVDTGFLSMVSLAARQLSEQKHGALVVIERGTRLDDIAERGVTMDARVSDDLLTQIFYPNSPLHDGAVIIRNGRILAARVVLPQSEHASQSRHLGTRHLAANAITRLADVVAVVVSEETGTISLAEDGRLVRGLDEGELNKRLYRALTEASEPVQRVSENVESVGRLFGALAGRLGLGREQSVEADESAVAEAAQPAKNEAAIAAPTPTASKVETPKEDGR
jgi:diadenylate cyclase